MTLKLNYAGYALITFCVAVAWVVALTHSGKKPSALPSLVGCYSGSGLLGTQKIAVKASGLLLADGQAIGATAYEDKQGLSLLPNKKIIVSYSPSPRLIVAKGNPLLIRSSKDNNNLTILSEEGPAANFNRISCPSGT